MPSNNSALRQILLIRILSHGRGYSFAELQKYMEKQLEGKPYSERTFFRDTKAIREIRKIAIVYDRKNDIHLITTAPDELNTKVLESFEMLNVLMGKENFSAYIQFENRRPDGIQHFQILLQAIKDHKVVKFKHHKYYEDVTTDRLVDPYALKEFKGRWYLLAVDRKNGKPRTFGLDKISQLEVKPGKFAYSKDFDPRQLFKDCFGIITPGEGEQIQHVVLSFNPEQGKYIKSYKLHVSQAELVDEEEEYRISLDVFITYDLVMEILSYGREVEILAPESLKKEVKHHLLNTLNYY